MQLPLELTLRHNATFENFAYPEKHPLLSLLQEMARGRGESILYLWGAEGCGKTHLLQATCHRAALHGTSIVYLPLRELLQYGIEVLQGMEAHDLLCIDDIDAIAGNQEWEHQLFALFNRMRDRNARLITSAHASPTETGIRLPDLVSRLSWGPVFHLALLSDTEKLRALQLRAGTRGLELPEEVGRYLLRYYPRDLQIQFELLDRLDQASLVQQRKLTVPFVRDVLGNL